MRLYWKYTAIDCMGQCLTGHVWGDKAEAMQNIATQNLTLVRLAPSLRAWLNPRKQKPNDQELYQFFDDLYQMTQGAILLQDALKNVQELHGRSQINRMCDALIADISKGLTFAEAVKQTTLFPSIVCRVIESCEKSGQMETAFDVLRKYFERMVLLRQKLAQAMIYPAVVLIVLIGIVIFLSMYVMPKLKSLLPSTKDVSWLTRLCLGGSGILNEHGLLISLILGGVCVGGVIYIAMNKERWQSWVEAFPVVGRIYKEMQIAQCVLCLSVLIKSGVPVFRALQSISDKQNTACSREIRYILTFMLSGLSLWQSMAKSSYFSGNIISMVRRGEELALLDEYCLRLARQLDERVFDRLQRCVGVLQPALMMITGLLLCAVAMGFLIPIYGNLTNVASGGF